jgi:hypothetical protein
VNPIKGVWGPFNTKYLMKYTLIRLEYKYNCSLGHHVKNIFYIFFLLEHTFETHTWNKIPNYKKIDLDFLKISYWINLEIILNENIFLEVKRIRTKYQKWNP